MRKLHLLLAIILLTFSTRAQVVAMNTSVKFANNITNDISDKEIIPLIEETTYTYKYQGKDVVVIFTEDEHIEYFNDKKHYIKSSIKWISDDECYMTLKESTLPNFPFRSGTELRFKITKIKKGKVFYESTLAGRTWIGKMKQI